MMDISDHWYRIICSNCKEGTMFFTKQVPEIGTQPVYEYAINHDFIEARCGEMPQCDNCKSVMGRTHGQCAEDSEAVEDRCIVNLLSSTQNNRGDI